MQYSYVHGIKTEPKLSLKGICPTCKQEVVARCGSVKIHHWAHTNLKDCDQWSEPETKWHRDWKSKFPQEFREVPFQDSITKEIHRADIHTSAGVTIEFQNSPISLNELHSRDNFYKKLIWVVNATHFKSAITLTCNIPNPTDPVLGNFSITGIGKYSENAIENLMFFRTPTHGRDFDSDRILNINDPWLIEVKALYEKQRSIFWMFNWKNKRTVWFSSASQVFFDFGDEHLYWLKFKKQYRGETNLWYFQVSKKNDFIKKYSTIGV